MPDAQPQFQNSVDVKLDYIQRDLREMKVDIKDIKTDFVNRREFTEALNAIRDEISPLRRIIYGIVALMGVAVFGAIFKLVIK